MTQAELDITEQELRELTFRASTLYERLKWTGVLAEDPTETKRIDTRLRTWCKNSAAGDQDRFAKRLTQLGHTIETIRPYLGSKPPPFATDPLGSTKVPSWAALLRECMVWVICQGPPSITANSAIEFLDAAEPIAFEHVLAPLAEFARLRLAEQHGLLFQLLSEKTGYILCRYLLKLLSFAASAPLLLEFSLFRHRRRHPASGHSGRLAAPASNSGETNQNYLRFCQRLLQDGLRGFLREYSFLGRRLATFMEFWLEATGEFLQRLDADLPALAAHFNQGRHPGKVALVKLGLSDRHNRGRSVILVHFEDGLRVMYKPKDIGLERAFFEFVHSHGSPASSGGGLELRTLGTLVRPGYGWVEYAEDKPCEDPVQLPRFFQRSGQLLGLLFGLNGYDFYNENLVASGEHPVPVDLETLLNPDSRLLEIANLAGNEKPIHARQRSIPSEQLFTVLTCGFLPYWSTGPNRQPFDQSGFGGFQDQHTAYEVREFTAVNTDNMQMALKPLEMEKPKNLPHVDATAARPDDHVDAIVRGFEESYRFWLSVRSTACDGHDIHARFKKLRSRHVFRRTQVYAALQEQTNGIEYQREGVDASLVWDRMSQAFRLLQRNDPMLAILEAEHRDMACDDIPVFYMSTSSRSLTIPAGPRLQNYFRRSGWSTLKRHLRALNRQDMDRQSSLIRHSFHARQAGPLEWSNHVQPLVEPDEPVEPWDVDERLLSTIPVAIAERILSGAFADGAGHLFWSGLGPDPAIERLTVGLLGTAFYQGQGGIAFFLAALERAFPGQGYGEAAVGALRLLSQELRLFGRLPDTGAKVSLGGMSGVGSLVYSFLRAGLLLGRDDFIGDAETLAGFISEPLIEADEDLDVMAGSAGAILTLLALYRHTGGEALLDTATRCGRHLVNRRVPTAAGFQAWPTVEGRLLTGFSHGAAGISYALFKLFEQSGLPEFREAACEGMEYERHVFVPEQSNWPDFRNSEQEPTFPNQWCHGATGIGYSRLGMMAAGPMPGVERDIAAAVGLTLRQPLVRVDHLCCGNAGQISFLFDAARQMKRPDWETAARTRLGRLLALRGPDNAYRYFSHLPPSAFNPGFMQGAAGIGYAWLRLAQPDLGLPCCLLLD